MLQIIVVAHCYQHRNNIYFEPYFDNRIEHVMKRNVGKSKKHESFGFNNENIFDLRKGILNNLMNGFYNFFVCFKDNNNKIIHIKNKKIESISIIQYKREYSLYKCSKKKFYYIPSTIEIVKETNNNIGLKFITSLYINHRQIATETKGFFGKKYYLDGDGFFSFKIKLKDNVIVNPSFSKIIISTIDYHNLKSLPSIKQNQSHQD